MRYSIICFGIATAFICSSPAYGQANGNAKFSSFGLQGELDAYISSADNCTFGSMSIFLNQNSSDLNIKNGVPSGYGWLSYNNYCAGEFFYGPGESSSLNLDIQGNSGKLPKTFSGSGTFIFTNLNGSNTITAFATFSLNTNPFTTSSQGHEISTFTDGQNVYRSNVHWDNVRSHGGVNNSTISIPNLTATVTNTYVSISKYHSLQVSK